MDPRAEFAAFLKSRRARLSPEEAGLEPFGDRRRVPGLRREELAQLASLSMTYLTRLEQGRAGNVSEHVLLALSDALRLDGDERAHLQTLVDRARNPLSPSPPEHVRPQLLHVIARMHEVPAMVVGRRLDVLGWNTLAHRLYAPDMSFDAAAQPATRPNTGRRCFLHEPTRALYDDWETVARDNVAYLRMAAARYPDDRELAELIGQLTMGSPEFASMWADHPIQDVGHATRTFLHPTVGPMELTEEVVTLADDRGLRMLLVSAEPGTPSEQGLERLAMSAHPHPARSGRGHGHAR